jgi:hypothetical protein
MLPSYLWQMVEDNQKIKDLEDKLSYVAEVRDLDTKFKAVQRVGEWQLEQLKLMDPRTNKGVKRLGEWQLQQLKLIDTEKTKQLLKLHNMEKGKWKVERDKLRVERDNWKVTCKKLKDEACVREQQLRKLTMESQRWKAECTKVVTAEFQGKDVIGVCRDLLDQLQVEQKSLDLQRRTGDWQKVPNSKTPTAELKKLSDGTRGQPAQNYRDISKIRSESEDCVSQQQLQQKVRAGKSEGERLEEVCKDLLYQLERRNIEIRSNQVNLQKASKWQALMQREINDYKEEIKQLKKTEASNRALHLNALFCPDLPA